MKTQFTRKQYMDREVSHRDYHDQFVNDRIISMLSHMRTKILVSEDEYLNDIPLRQWDSLVTFLPGHVPRMLKEAGDFLSLATGVCILKAAARRIRLEEGIEIL